MIGKIRKMIPREEFDYQLLMDSFKGYERPRDKITDLIRKGQIIRVKKGLYVFGPEHRVRPYSREILANLIYGPSYLSLDYALSYYGLIPERVEVLTSVTTGRSRSFSTPVGIFSYRTIPLEAFRVGMVRVEVHDGGSFMIATPEKALIDKVHLDRGIGLKNRRDMESYVFESLRIDRGTMENLDVRRLGEYACGFRSLRVKILVSLVSRLQREVRGSNHA